MGAGRYLGAHSALLVGAALAFAGNPYLLVLVIPALHVWLLLPITARLGAAARAAVVLAGWLGPAAVIALLAGAGGFGVDAPAWFVRLIGDGGIPLAASARAGDPGLGDDRAAVARGRRRRRHPDGGWRDPRNRV